MAFAFRRQPLKLLYTLFTVVSVLIVRLPLWALTSLSPSWRPRRSWSMGRAVVVHVLRAVVDLQYSTGLGFDGGDHEQQARNAASLGFVWVDPLSPDLIQGFVAQAAATNSVSPVRAPGYWFGPRDEHGRHGQRAAPNERVLYSLHGGGYVSGSSNPKSPVAAIFHGITQHCAPFVTRVFALDYRLCSASPFQPANAFPASLLDALAGYRYLVHDLGFLPQNIIIEGDSAGGHLTVNLARYLVEAAIPALPPPGALLLLSPTLDWASTHDANPDSSMERNKHSDYVKTILQSGYPARGLLGNLPREVLSTSEYLSPASLSLPNAFGNFKDFPPTCIIAGDAEQTLDPMRTFRDRLVGDIGKDAVTYHEYPDAIHDWLFMPFFEPQRSDALEDIARWIKSVMNGSD